jgi:hypothetical protein
MRTAALLAILLVACTSAPPLPSGEPVGERVRPREVLLLAVVDADPSAHFDRTLLVEATVTAVCQKKGCWMKIEDSGHSAMVRWESGCGGRYAFPAEATGRRVLIQGSFYPKTISPEDVEHLQEEAPAGVTIESETYEFNASAILILDA